MSAGRPLKSLHRRYLIRISVCQDDGEIYTALRRRKKSLQQELFVTTDSLPTSDGQVFNSKVKQLLADEGLDRWIEELCASFYSPIRGRPGISPGIYFRILLVGYFEGIQSQWEIARLFVNSLSLRKFLGSH
jgi:transposase